MALHELVTETLHLKGLCEDHLLETRSKLKLVSRCVSMLVVEY